MSINLQGRKLVFYGGVLAVFGLILGGVSFWRVLHNKSLQDPTMATFSLNQAMRVLPQWGRYRQVNQEIDELHGKLVELGLMPKSLKSEGVGLSGSQPPLDDPNSIFQLDIEAHREAIIDNTKSWQKALISDLNDRTEAKANQLQDKMRNEIAQQKDVYERKLKEYQQELELDYSLKLTDYDFKLKSPGISDTEKNLLNKETQSVKDEMTGLLETKKAEYAKALESYSKQCQQSMSEEMKAYQVELRSEFERAMTEKKLDMEKEFGSWVNQEKRLYQNKMENLQKKYLPDILKFKALNAERESLNLEMKSTIRRMLKPLLAKKKIDVVIINPSNGFKQTEAILSFTEGKNITNELINVLR